MTPFYDDDVFDSELDFTELDPQPESRAGTRELRLSDWIKVTTAAVGAAAAIFVASPRSQFYSPVFEIGSYIQEAQRVANAEHASSWRARAALVRTSLYRADPHPAEDEPLPDYGF